VETARSNNRQGEKLGGANIRAASETMKQRMLQKAEAL
jgi:hypothetical protein